MLYSFDVFDTLITRRTATPEGIFTLMQEKLEAGEVPGIPITVSCNFYELRIHAGELAYHNDCVCGREEVSLVRIYQALSLQCGLDIREQKALADLELTTEAENILGIRQNIDKVEELLSRGERVILISDMYMDSDSVRGLLNRVDTRLANLPLYVSSDYARTKRTGSLYKIVKKSEQIEYSDWTHCGDNLHSDMRIPERLGINTDYYKDTKYRDIERKLLEHRNNGYLQRSIGTTRQLLAQGNVNLSKRMGMSQGGPILYAYVWWILDECCRQDIHRLYFIARDGYVLKQIAEIVVGLYHYDMELHYLYGSRKAWRMAGFHSGRGRVYDLVRWSHTFDICTPSDLAEVFQIDVEELLPWLPGGLNKDTDLAPEVLHALVRNLDCKMEFQEFLVDKNKRKRRNVQAYLKQEISQDDVRFAFVDLAGGGYTQGCLADMMEELGFEPIKSFYFKMDSIRKDKNCSYQVFLPGYLQSNLLIEMLGRACHGQTSSYKRVGDRIVPVLEAVEEEALKQQGILEYLHGVEAYAEHFTRCLIMDQRRGDDIEAVLAYFNYIANIPDQETMDYWGNMPSGVTGRERRAVEYAPVLTEAIAWKMYFAFDSSREPVQQFYHGSDPDYSVIRSSRGVRKRIEIYKKYYNSPAGRLIRCFTHPPRSRQAGRLGIYRDFPLELLTGRIVLYGCGKFGCYLYKRISRQRKGKCQIVLWVDAQPGLSLKEGMEVHLPEAVMGVEFDMIIIGVLKTDAASQIKDILLKHKVPEEKILWIDMWGNVNYLWQS